MAKKVRIVCAHQAVKDCLINKGLDLCGRRVGLNEPGNGLRKVAIQDIPIEMPNDDIKARVEQYEAPMENWSQVCSCRSAQGIHCTLC